MTTRAQLLAEVEPAWNRLNQPLDRLSETELAGTHDTQGWSVTDHLVHLAAWQRPAAIVLRGRSRPASWMIR